MSAKYTSVTLSTLLWLLSISLSISAPRNLQIRVHVYFLRHYCGDWLAFDCFVPMIADHNLMKKSFGSTIADHDLVKKR